MQKFRVYADWLLKLETTSYKEAIFYAQGLAAVKHERVKVVDLSGAIVWHNRLSDSEYFEKLFRD